ncbi:hypothetical protein DM02DRAFT_667744 [Periconia macrospinosa]|uniref:Uncharacterized protein n=1 Tax=Periconia macrospinosa TaxID=97972 RepID=A0A2V1EA60_9PLEO|nr:hypothetical protein DM02DRAFT_667744 [Periconia macrospinosa]
MPRAYEVFISGLKGTHSIEKGIAYYYRGRYIYDTGGKPIAPAPFSTGNKAQVRDLRTNFSPPYRADDPTLAEETDTSALDWSKKREQKKRQGTHEQDHTPNTEGPSSEQSFEPSSLLPSAMMLFSNSDRQYNSSAHNLALSTPRSIFPNAPNSSMHTKLLPIPEHESFPNVPSHHLRRYAAWIQYRSKRQNSSQHRSSAPSASSTSPQLEYHDSLEPLPLPSSTTSFTTSFTTQVLRSRGTRPSSPPPGSRCRPCHPSSPQLHHPRPRPPPPPPHPRPGLRRCLDPIPHLSGVSSGWVGRQQKRAFERLLQNAERDAKAFVTAEPRMQRARLRAPTSTSRAGCKGFRYCRVENSGGTSATCANRAASSSARFSAFFNRRSSQQEQLQLQTLECSEP